MNTLLLAVGQLASRSPFQNLHGIGGAEYWLVRETHLGPRNRRTRDLVPLILFTATRLALSIGKVFQGRGSLSIKFIEAGVRIQYLEADRSEQASHGLEGRVLDPAGMPLGRVEVRLAAGGDVKALSDDRGYFSFRGLESDRYLISAHPPGFIPKSATVKLTSGVTVQDLVMTPKI